MVVYSGDMAPDKALDLGTARLANLTGINDFFFGGREGTGFSFAVRRPESAAADSDNGPGV